LYFFLRNTILLIVLLLFNISCSSSIADKSIIKLNNKNLHKTKISTTIYQHNYFTNNIKPNKRVHIYIGSDGTPWIKGKWLAIDPTPTNPLALALMAKDKTAAIFLARPCYFESKLPDYCEATLWSSARYSIKVINSMHLAINELISQDTEIVLIGYSGGATIATILADKLENAIGLITIAGNLDTQLWTLHHNLLPLTDSINPSSYIYSNKSISSVHLAGGKDLVIPLKIIHSYIAKRGGTLLVYDRYTHGCCWLNDWPSDLKRTMAILEKK